MSKKCNLASQNKIGAAYVLGQLVIWAEGQKPTPCHQVQIEYWPYRIYPPQYQIVACVDEGVICTQVLMPYRVAQFFRVSQEMLDAMGGFAVVHHSGGSERVKINIIKLAAEQTQKLSLDASGGGLPSPFAAGGDVPFPFRVGNFIASGRAEDIAFQSRDDVSLHTATGYSEAFSFREAFQNAINNLPPDPNPFPDKLTNVVVVGTGANFGGIAGLNRMYVSVISYY